MERISVNGHTISRVSTTPSLPRTSAVGSAGPYGANDFAYDSLDKNIPLQDPPAKLGGESGTVMRAAALCAHIRGSRFPAYAFSVCFTGLCPCIGFPPPEVATDRGIRELDDYREDGGAH